MSEEKIKVLCDYTEYISKADGLELLGIVWSEKENKGRIMCNFPNVDDKRVYFLLSAIIALTIDGLKNKGSQEKDVDEYLTALSKQAKFMVEHMRFKFEDKKNEDA